MKQEEKLELTASNYAIGMFEKDRTYTSLEVHKMICDAFMAGSKYQLKKELTMKQEEKQKLLGFRQWLIDMTEKWQNESKDPTNSPCGTHYDSGIADGFIRARTEFETLFDFLDEY